MVTHKVTHPAVIKPDRSIAHLLGRPVLNCVRGACVIVIVAMPIVVVTAVVWALVTALS